MTVTASLRMCSICQAIKRFIGTKCRTCGKRIPKSDLEFHPPVEASRCRTCQALVAATIDQQCGLCSATSEHLRRRKSGTLSREDRSEFAYHQKRKRKIGAKQAVIATTGNTSASKAPGHPRDLEREDKTVPLSD